MHAQLVFRTSPKQGFTLVELAIVIVIIGLVIGGVVVGKTLVRSAQLRSTLTQLEKVKTAVNVFQEKYRAFPGDLPSSVANGFGFDDRGSHAGQGDGNALIEGVSANAASSNSGFYQATGETAMFWSDMTFAGGLNIGLIEGDFRTASPTVVPDADITGKEVSTFLPKTRLGSNYLYVYSNGGLNYYGLSAVSSIVATDLGEMDSCPAMTVIDAYEMDTKLDDGFPQSGNITAKFPAGTAMQWAGGGGCSGGGYSGSDNPGADDADDAAAADSVTCYDNNNTGGQRHTYSIGYNKGAGLNCALSFQYN